MSKSEKRRLAKDLKKKEKQKLEKTATARNWVVGFIVLIVVGFFGYQFITWLNTPSSTPELPETASIELTDSEWTKGNPESKNVLVEYADFQCPACARAAMDSKRLGEEEGQSVLVVYRHFPLISIHPQAMAAAKAAEAAGKQGKFWEMHDLLFEKQQDWSGDGGAEKVFENYAEGMGLNIDQYRSDFDSEETTKAISSDIVSGNKAGINSTPTFFLNGSRLVYNGTYESLLNRVKSSEAPE